jgi:hypothetical protein
LEHERVPSLRTPALRYASPFNDEVLQTALTKVVAHGEPRLAPADDDGLDLIHRSEELETIERTGPARRASPGKP